LRAAAKTIIDCFTDLWWFAKAGKREGLANRTATVHRSFAPSSVEELVDRWEREGGNGEEDGDETKKSGDMFAMTFSDFWKVNVGIHESV
jgi:hypothetical protein